MTQPYQLEGVFVRNDASLYDVFLSSSDDMKLVSQPSLNE